MKRLGMLILSWILVFSLTACSGGTDNGSGDGKADEKLSAAYKQYLDVLKADEKEVDVINNPDCKGWLTNSAEDELNLIIESDNVALMDINGDKIPELFEQCFLSDTTPEVRVYSSDGENVKRLNLNLTSIIANPRGGGSYLFSSKSMDCIYRVTYGDVDEGEFSVTRYELIGDKLVSDGYYAHYIVDHTTNPETYGYLHDTGERFDNEISKDEFYKTLDEYVKDIDKCIYDSVKTLGIERESEYAFIRKVSAIAEKGSGGMKYEDLIKYLKSEIKD